MMKLTQAMRGTLVAIVAAGAAGTFFPENKIKKLAEANLVEFNPEVTNENGIAVRATEAGVAAVQEQSNEDGEASKQDAVVIAKAIPMPEAKRGPSAGNSKYPFDTMENGDSFFIPATEETPEPAKKRASTVTSANARYAHPCPEGRTKTNRAGDEVPVMVYDRKFAIRPMEDGAAWGFPGVAGAGVWRIL